jgi:glucose/arabinose dehydrogenase
MLITAATLALLTLFVGLGVCGVLLIRRRRRVVGGILLVQALLLTAALVALATVPVGIGNPLIRVPLGEVTLQAGAALLSIVLIGGLLYLLARMVIKRLQAPRTQRVASLGLLLTLPVAASASMAGLAYWSTPERERERAPEKREITLAPGFNWEIYVRGVIDNPTAIAFGPDDKLYIADIAGTLWVASDDDGDGSAETITPFADGFTLLIGIVWHDSEIYCASSGKVEALRDSNGDGRADERRLVVDDLPSMVLMPHSNNGLAFGPDGRLYFGVGATTNGQVEQHPLAASILSIKPDGSDLKVFARGLGNSFDVAFNSRGELFAGGNAPGDEFNHVVEGGHYGYPYFYGDPPKVGGIRGPVVNFPPHSVPTGVTFYAGDTYPREFYDNGFLTLWQRGEIARIEVAQATNGSYLSRTTTFGSGFLYPIDAITGPDGNLYVADFGTSAIYRITYDEGQAFTR